MVTQHSYFVFRRKISNVDLQQETVKLCLWQRIRALELDWVFSADHGKYLGERMARSVDRYLPFLHALEQGSLRSGRHAIDFIDEKEVSKHWAVVQGKG